MRRSTSIAVGLMVGLAACVVSVPAEAAFSKNAKARAAVQFLDTVFNQKKVKEGFDKYVGGKYIQHNPIAADGKDAAVEVLGRVLKMVPDWSYEFKHSYADGNIAIVHSLVRRDANDRGSAVIDVFRFEKGKIVEHWDVIQAIPEKSANDNTMF